MSSFQSLRRHRAHARLDELIRQSAPRPARNRSAYWRLIHAVRAARGLLYPPSEFGWRQILLKRGMISACARIAHHAGAWNRTPETWIAPETGPTVAFRSLINHLFARYPVPNFMTRVWLTSRRRDWKLFLHLARGHSVRRFDTPIRLTKTAAAFFLQAPDDLLPTCALRWAQIRALGGDARLARLLVSRTNLCAETTDEPFWESVLRFLIDADPMSDDEILDTVRFIEQQRFAPAETTWSRGAGTAPLQPDFKIQGRTLQSLRRHMTHWREEILASRLDLAALPHSGCWVRTPIKPFEYQEGDRLWTIEELLTARDVGIEGALMKHCVADYISDCAQGRTSIWSMKCHESGHGKRILTIELVPKSREIIQAKGKRNAAPSETARRLLHCWAAQEQLKVGDLE